MITCQIVGGLGNLLFRVAATVALARRNNDACYFNTRQHIKLQGRSQESSINYENNILRKVEKRYINANTTYAYHGPLYKEIPYSQNMVLDGYFQSERYFKDAEIQIRELFEIPDELNEYIKTKYGDLSEYVSLHVRRGDYVIFKDVYELCSMEYYKKALELFPDKKVLVISDDINWCKNNFKLNNVIFVENEKEVVDLYIMSKCEHNIISNSTFAWWGAWLNGNQNKKVVYPSKWFSQPFVQQHNYTDVYGCENWIKI
jgi:hypothetical protein